MRKLLFTCLLFMSVTSKAQLQERTDLPFTIGSFSSSLKMSQAELTGIVVNGDTVYTLAYRIRDDKRFPWATVKFKETGGTLNGLYNLFNSFFATEHKNDEKYRKNFKLGEVDVTCTNYLGLPHQIYFETRDGSFYIKPKQLNALFGR